MGPVTATPEIPSPLPPPPAHPTESALLHAAWALIHDPGAPARHGHSPTRLALAALVPLAQAGWPRRKALAYLAQDGPGLAPLHALSERHQERVLTFSWTRATTLVSPRRHALVAAILATRWRVATGPAPAKTGETDRLVALCVLSVAADWRSDTVLLSAEAIAAATGLGIATVHRSLARFAANASSVTPRSAAAPSRRRGRGGASSSSRDNSSKRTRRTSPRKSLIDVTGRRPGHPNRLRVHPDRDGAVQPAAASGGAAALGDNAPACSPSFRGELVAYRAAALDGDAPSRSAAAAQWLCEHCGHDAFARTAAGPVGHHLCCVLVEGEATTTELAGRCGHDADHVRGALARLEAGGVIARTGPTAPWALCDPARLEAALDAVAARCGTTGAWAARAKRYAEAAAARRAAVASHARRLSDERAATAAIRALEAGRAPPWALGEPQRRDAVEGLAPRVLEAAGVALETAGRATRAGAWDKDDVALVAGLVVEGLGWPEGWEATQAWVSARVAELAQRIEVVA